MATPSYKNTLKFFPRVRRCPVIDGDIVRIPLTRGREAIIDKSDVGIIMGRSWQDSRGVYVVTTVNCHKVYLHRILMRPPDGYVVDHINGDTYDNRRSNLRVCSPEENQWNRKPHCKNKSGFRGVGLHACGKWRARLRLPSGKDAHLGLFDSPEEAARAYDAAAKVIRGDFAKLNFSQ